MRVLICGGGVIGACTAYFLARRGIDVIVVERTGVACAASGKAGGFLAIDWCAGSPLDALARRSFALHAELAARIDGDWSYRRMNAYSGFVVRDDDARRHAPAALDWLSDGTVISHHWLQNGYHCLVCSDGKARASSTTPGRTCRLTRSSSNIGMRPETN